MDIFSLAYEIHDDLLNSLEFKRLKDLEKKMLDDKLASNLLNNYHKLLEKYNFNKTNELLKKLSDSKIKLYENEIIKEYLEAYKEVSLLIGSITDVVFKDFKKDSLIEEILKIK